MIASLGGRTVISRTIIDFRASVRRPLDLKARRCPSTPPLVADCSVCHDSVRFAKSGARNLRRNVGDRWRSCLDWPAKRTRPWQSSVVSESTDTNRSSSIMKVGLGTAVTACRALALRRFELSLQTRNALDATKRHPGPRRIRREQAEAARDVRPIAVA